MKIDKDKLDDYQKSLQIMQDSAIGKGKRLYDNLSIEDKTALVAYIVHILYQHAKEGGTYRYLLYDRLELTDYVLFQCVGLLDLHNLISGELKG